MFAHKLKFILLPKLIATLNNLHVHFLHWLMLTGLLSLNALCWPCKSMTDELAPKECYKLAVGTWYGSNCQCMSVSKPCSGILALLWMPVHVITTLNSTVYVFFLLWLSFCHHPPHPRHPPTHPLIYTGPILMSSIRIVKNLWKSAIVYLSG